MARDYNKLMELLPNNMAREFAMQSLVDIAWEHLHATGVSWIGFYLHTGGDELILGPRRDKPACSPIGLHGACGRALLTKQPFIVRDVKDLGPNYIACDPRDRSEVVLPCIDESGICWGVLDADSHELAAFDEGDVVGLMRVLKTAGLTA